jgi:nucleoside-diphosphate-sugar epimerase
MSNHLCIVTGASGYLGSQVKTKFAHQGWKVLELTRTPVIGTRAIAFQLGKAVAHENLSGAQALVHCAYDFTLINQKDIWKVNVQGTEKLFSAAREAGVEKIVCISTISAFEGCQSLYGQAKLEIEKIAAQHGALSIRPGLIYGDPPGGMFGHLVEQVEKFKIIPLVGDGSQIQYLVHQDDLCDFIYRYCTGEIPLPDTVVTAAHEKGWTLRELLEAIARQKGQKRIFLGLPWPLLLAALRTAELLHIPLKFHSDSVVSLMNQNLKPDFTHNHKLGLHCRPFSI